MPSHEFLEAYRCVYAQLSPAPPAERPGLIILSGLPGTGKSTLASKLAVTLPATVIASDQVRKILFPRPTHSGAESLFVHAVSRALIRHSLKTRRNVIADSTNLVEWHRRLLLQVAKAVGVPALIVQTTAPAEVVRQRLDERLVNPAPHDFSGADWRIYKHMSREVQPIQTPYLRIDTTRELDRELGRILRAVRRAEREYYNSG